MNDSAVSFFSDKKGYLMPDGTWSWSVNAIDAYKSPPTNNAVKLRDKLQSVVGNVNIVWAHNNAIAYYETDGWSEWTHNLS
jgi:hypothetical protein